METSNSAFDNFLTEHCWAVLTTLRSSGAPVNSVVAYARQVFAAIEHTAFTLPDPLAPWLEAQQRVILRTKPTRISGVIR